MKIHEIKEKIPPGTESFFIRDFIKDFRTDFWSYRDAGKIQITPTQAATTPSSTPAPDTSQIVAQRKQQQQKAQTKPGITKPVDREEDLEGVAVLGYNENIKFDMFNTLLESIISEQQTAAPTPATTSDSIADWTIKWFSSYMDGVNWADKKNEIETISQNIQQSYNTGKWESEVKKLATAAWNIVSANKKIPRGAENVWNSQPSNNRLTTKDLKAAILALAKKDPREYERLQQDVQDQLKRS